MFSRAILKLQEEQEKVKPIFHVREEKAQFLMLFPYYEKRQRNFPIHLNFKEGILILIRNGPFLTSNTPKTSMLTNKRNN